jgi:hypothetical protein
MATPPAGSQGHEPDNWLLLPFKAIAFVVVLPFRLVWEAVRLLGKVFRWVVILPVTWLLLALRATVAFLFEYLVAIPARWFWEWCLLPLLRLTYSWLLRPLGLALAWLASATYRRVLRPVGVALAWAAALVHRRLLRPLGLACRWLILAAYRWILLPLGIAVARVAAFVHRRLLTPIGHAALVLLAGLAWLVRTGWRATTWAGRLLYRWVLRPVGLAIAWVSRLVHRRLLMPIGHAIAWAAGLVCTVWRSTVSPVARWVGRAFSLLSDSEGPQPPPRRPSSRSVPRRPVAYTPPPSFYAPPVFPAPPGHVDGSRGRHTRFPGLSGRAQLINVRRQVGAAFRPVPAHGFRPAGDARSTVTFSLPESANRMGCRSISLADQQETKARGDTKCARPT